MLPLEIWYHIIDMMPLQDQLLYARAICRDWRNYILAKKKLDLSSSLKSKIPFKLLLLFDKNTVKELIIDRIIIEPKILSKIFKRYDKVTKLSITYVESYWSVYQNLSNFKELKYLDATGTRHISNWSFSGIAYNCKNLEVIILKNHYYLEKKQLIWLLIIFKKLKYLDIRGCHINRSQLEPVVKIYQKKIQILY